MSTTNRTREAGAKDQLRDQLGTVKEDLGEMGNLVKSATSETVGEAKDFVDEKRGQSRELEDALLDRVRSRPLESVAIAAGMGLVLGFLSRR